MKINLIKRGMNRIRFLLLIYDMIAINLAYFIALWLRFDCKFTAIPDMFIEPAIIIAPFYTSIMLCVLGLMRLYRSVWRYASVPELMRVFGASVIGGFVQIAGTLIFLRRMPISYYAIGWILMFSALAVSRFTYSIVSRK